MKSNEQQREMQRLEADKQSIVPAIVTCVTCMGGTLGALLIAAGPWLALSWSW